MRLNFNHNRDFIGVAVRSLVLLAFLVRSVIPAGFMPNMSGMAGASDKVFPLVICSGAGSSIVYVGADKMPLPVKSDGSPSNPSGHGPCVFSAGFASGTLPATFLPAPGLFFSQNSAPETPVGLAAAPTPKPWLSQGPPSLLLHA